MEKNLKAIASDFLMEVSMELGTKRVFGLSKEHAMYCYHANVPLLNGKNEEGKMFISSISTRVLDNGATKHTTIMTSDDFSKSVRVCDEEYLRLVVRSICAGNRNLTERWLKKLTTLD